MKNKLIMFLLIALSLAILASCNIDISNHNHSYSKTWVVTDTEHWRAANCGHELISSKGTHEWDSGKTTKSATEEEEGEFTYTCGVCKTTKKDIIPRVNHVHKYGGDYIYNENYHWQAATCEHTEETSRSEPHSFNGNECSICKFLTVSKGLSYKLLDNGTYAVTGKGSCINTKIVIPATYEDKPVTTISEGAFSGTESLIKIIIPESVTSIEKNAFINCINLNEVVWKDGKSQLNSIGKYAFQADTALKSFTIPASVTHIGDGAFNDNCCLEEIVLEEGNTSYKMDNGALYTADGKTLIQYTLNNPATSFTIPNTVTTLSPGAFAYSANLTEIIFEEGSAITKIPNNAFLFIATLENVNIPSTVTYIGSNAFDRCGKLKELVIPSNVTYIGNYAFHRCLNVAPFEIPATVTTIGVYAFAECDQFVSVTIPDKVTEIGDYAFTGCSKLETVSIPASVSSFGTRVFYGCEVIKNISVDENNKKISDVDGNLYNKEKTRFIFYCVGKEAEEFTAPAGVTSLDVVSFYAAKNLKRVVLPEGLTTINKEAFRNCSNLEEIVVPNSVSTIETEAFTSCVSLKSFTIPTSLKTLTTLVFRDCKSLTEMTIPANVTMIEKRAFSNLENIKKVYFEVTEGWNYLSTLEDADYMPFDPADLADPETAAKFLTTPGYEHFNHYWKLVP